MSSEVSIHPPTEPASPVCSKSVAETSNFHDCVKLSEMEAVSRDEELKDQQPVDAAVYRDLLIEVSEKVKVFMHPRWIPVVQHEALHVEYVSSQSNLAIQRSVVFSTSGKVELFVHGESVNIEDYLKIFKPPLPLEADSVNYFVDTVVDIVNKLRVFEVCSGLDTEQFKAGWVDCSLGIIDHNPYRECRYVETFRSHSCLRLVTRHKWRCTACAKLYAPLKSRSLSAVVEHPNLNTNNRYLTGEPSMKKTACLHQDLQNANRKISCLQEKMQKILDKEGVDIESDVSSDLMEILMTSNLSPSQSIFLQQQVKASQSKNKVGMRWHPSMICLALSLHINSPSSYEMLRNTGMIKLPCSRTLFDYMRVKPPEEGIDPVVLESLALRVDKETKNHQKYFVLMADEMHISQNLIFQKSSGNLIGYVKLGEVDAEVKKLECLLEKPYVNVYPALASKVVAYTVKGVSNDMKGVVASYAVSMSVSQMYIRTWQVIGALERSGIAVIAFVSDGLSVNRELIKMHTPILDPNFQVVIGTTNKTAPRRFLYFLSDVPHLLNTVRNCLLNSRWDNQKSKRKMVLNKKRISWDFIIKLHESKKSKVLRKSSKLNIVNVFPDSYARMQVRYAAQVISRTVAQDLEDQKWPEASETVKFLRLCNDWFDCMNGAHTSMSQEKRNDNLKAYTSASDCRFQFLCDFINYLRAWKDEAYGVPNFSTDNVASARLETVEKDDSIGLEEEDGDPTDEETPASKRILADQTLEGIEMSTLAFVNMVRFLLNEGVEFVNARVFTQDPLDQHFIRLRAEQGGSNNPN